MFCCSCGASNPKGANYCHKCGSEMSTPSMETDHAEESPLQRKASSSEEESEQQRLVSELLPIDRKLHECHRCGRKEDLYGWDFGLGKVVSTRRNWAETALSVAASAVFVPLVGYGVLRLPGKASCLRVIRLRLILCGSCWGNRVNYALHPWWEPATRLGYTKFLNADELKKLQPV